MVPDDAAFGIGRMFVDAQRGKARAVQHAEMDGDVLHEHGMAAAYGVQLLAGGETLLRHERIVEAVGEYPLSRGRAFGPFPQAGETIVQTAADADGRRVEIFPVQHVRRQEDMPVRVAKAGHDGLPFHVAQAGLRPHEPLQLLACAHGKDALSGKRHRRGHAVAGIQREDGGVVEQLVGTGHKHLLCGGCPARRKAAASVVPAVLAPIRRRVCVSSSGSRLSRAARRPVPGISKAAGSSRWARWAWPA